MDVTPLSLHAMLMRMLCQLAQAHCSGLRQLMLLQAGLHQGAFPTAACGLQLCLHAAQCSITMGCIRLGCIRHFLGCKEAATSCCGSWGSCCLRVQPLCSGQHGVLKSRFIEQ